jgi:hypothetical protein
MRQAITTRYIGPTNHRGSRIKASCERGNVTVAYDHAMGVEDNHRAAAKVLLAKLGWDAADHSRGSEWFGGEINGAGKRVWVHAVPASKL